MINFFNISQLQQSGYTQISVKNVGGNVVEKVATANIFAEKKQPVAEEIGMVTHPSVHLVAMATTVAL